jgi:hypothetical protein
VAVVNDVGNVDGGCVGVASDDVAVAFGGSRCSAGVRGTGWGELGVLLDCLADLRRIFAKRGGSSSSVTVSIVADRCREQRMAWDVVSSLMQVAVAVWASDMALVSILEVLATGMCATVGSDVVTSAGGLGRATGAVIAGLGSLSSGGSVCRAAHRRLGAALVWTLTLVVGAASVWVSASSRMTAPQKSARAWAAIDRQSPAPCPSVSHFRRSCSFPSCIPSS